jgi:hypothetical protein
MSRLADPSSRITFAGVPDGRTRNLPVLSSSGHSGMDITPPSPAGAHGSPDDRAMNNGDGNSLNPPNPAIGAAAAAQQPKVVQTAFIHKLYKYVVSLALAPVSLTLRTAC